MWVCGLYQLNSVFIFNEYVALIRWSQGLIFHQAVVDCARAAILLPMGRSFFLCEAISKCALVETTFLLLVTVSTVNLLTTVLNDAPILPDEDNEDTISLLKDSPQCVSFGLFMIWWVDIIKHRLDLELVWWTKTNYQILIITNQVLKYNNQPGTNLPEWSSGSQRWRSHSPALVSPGPGRNYLSADRIEIIYGCKIFAQGPYRHYILNALWILINLLCIMLTLYQLKRLYRDFTTKNLAAVRIAGLFTSLLSIQTEVTLAASQKRGDFNYSTFEGNCFVLNIIWRREPTSLVGTILQRNLNHILMCWSWF